MLLFLLACTTSELSQSYDIDRVRVLAVAAEPAEPQPGDTVTFTSLVVSPNEPLLGTAWFVCDPTSLSEDGGCSFDTSLFDDPSSLTPEDMQAAGFIGFEPYFSPVWTVPDDFLDGLSDAEKLEGTEATVDVVALPSDGTDTGVDQDDVEIAYKRVPVSLATTPNHNPTVTGLRVSGFDVPDGSLVELDAGATYDIEAVLSDDSIETYTYVNSDGESEERTEEPYLNWYLQEGSFDQVNTLYPTLTARYTTPSEVPDSDLGLWVVVRDRRGGMAWSQITVRVRSTGS